MRLAPLLLLAAACSPLERIDVQVGGVGRDAFVHVPEALPDHPPLLLAFHGGGLGDARGRRMARLTRFAELADAQGFVVAFPNAHGGSWGDGPDATPDDVAFVDALIARLAERVPQLDLDRVYAAGFSNGGFFSLRLACERPDLVAAVASVSGSMLEGVPCPADLPVSVMLVAGTEDRVVPMEGGPVAGMRRTLALPFEKVVDDWTGRLACTAGPETRSGEVAPDGTRVLGRAWTGCDGGAEVTALTVIGGGHQWPGGEPVAPEVIAGPVADALDASEAVWRFLSRQAPR